jgi:hypothetical protein
MAGAAKKDERYRGGEAPDGEPITAEATALGTAAAKLSVPSAAVASAVVELARRDVRAGCATDPMLLRLERDPAAADCSAERSTEPAAAGEIGGRAADPEVLFSSALVAPRASPAVVAVFVLRLTTPMPWMALKLVSWAHKLGGRACLRRASSPPAPCPTARRSRSSLARSSRRSRS